MPDYTSTGQTTGGRDAYLRLGSTTNFTDGSIYGDALWQLFEGFLDEGTASHVRDKTGTDARPPLYPPDTTANLFANAGWRDHTDGNRITTTAGDKVEVIRGNYQLIVCGRMDDPDDDGAVLDISGGHIVPGDIAPGNVTRIEYKAQKFGGTWKVTEEAEKGHVHEIFRGEFMEEFRGSRRTSITGTVPSSLTSTFYADGTRGYDDNPDIVDGTWANTILEYTGSSDSAAKPRASRRTRTRPRCPTSTETWTGTITETVNANAVNSTSNVNTITENVGSAAHPCAVTSTHWGAATNTQFGAATDVLLGAKIDVFLGGVFELNFVGGHLGVTLAKNIDIIAGVHMEVHAGSFREITLGYKWDLVIGEEVENTFSSFSACTLTKTEVAAAILLG